MARRCRFPRSPRKTWVLSDIAADVANGTPTTSATRRGHGSSLNGAATAPPSVPQICGTKPVCQAPMFVGNRIGGGCPGLMADRRRHSIFDQDAINAEASVIQQAASRISVILVAEPCRSSDGRRLGGTPRGSCPRWGGRGLRGAGRNQRRRERRYTGDQNGGVPTAVPMLWMPELAFAGGCRRGFRGVRWRDL